MAAAQGVSVFEGITRYDLVSEITDRRPVDEVQNGEAPVDAVKNGGAPVDALQAG